MSTNVNVIHIGRVIGAAGKGGCVQEGVHDILKMCRGHVEPERHSGPTIQSILGDHSRVALQMGWYRYVMKARFHIQG